MVDRQLLVILASWKWGDLNLEYPNFMQFTSQKFNKQNLTINGISVPKKTVAKESFWTKEIDKTIISWNTSSEIVKMSYLYVSM